MRRPRSSVLFASPRPCRPDRNQVLPGPEPAPPLTNASSRLYSGMRLLILGATREPQQWLLQAGHEAVLMSSKDKVSLEDIRSGFTQIIVVDGRSRGEVGGIADP